MRNWIRNSHFHARHFGDSFSTSGGVGKQIAPQWWHGPGVGAATQGNFCEAIQGQWEGNPERFLRIQWLAPPSAGDGGLPPQPNFWNTILEQHINTARVLAGKEVTFSVQWRSPGGVQMMPILWRGYQGAAPDEYFTAGPQVWVSAGVMRTDYTLTLPGIPSGVPVALNSSLGVGLVILGQFGPTLDIGPMQLNEGGPKPIEETPGYEECLWALQT